MSLASSNDSFIDNNKKKMVIFLAWIFYISCYFVPNFVVAEATVGTLWGVLGAAIRNSSISTTSTSSYTRLGRFPLCQDTNNSVDDPIIGANRMNEYCHGVSQGSHHDNDDVTAIPIFSSRRRERQRYGRPHRRRFTMDKSLAIISSLASTKIKKTDQIPSSSPSTTRDDDDDDDDDSNNRKAMTRPIIPLSVSLDDQTGDIFSDNETMDMFVSSGLKMIAGDNDWIEWKMNDSTTKLLRDNNHNEMFVLERGEVLVYIGKAKQEGHGSKLPIIKTKSILPLASEEMATLLLDSSQVKIYNKLSVGRFDVRDFGDGRTKIVCNLTKPPISKSNMVSCTMMHSRTLISEGTSSPHRCLVISRATPGMIGDDLTDQPRNDILLGVNLLEDIGPNECLMTAVTHVYSPALPSILAKKLGVSSAVNFVKDIRNSCGVVAS